MRLIAKILMCGFIQTKNKHGEFMLYYYLFTIDAVSHKKALENKNSSLITKNSFPTVFSVPDLLILKRRTERNFHISF